jgi:hypothetical protein
MERLWIAAERERLAGAPDAGAANAFIDAAGNGSVRVVLISLRKAVE